MTTSAGYTSRRRRKRTARALARMAEAIAGKNHGNRARLQGDWGRLSRQDLLLVARACRRNWSPRQAVRAAIASTVVDQAVHDPRVRQRTAAARTLLEMDADNRRAAGVR